MTTGQLTFLHPEWLWLLPLLLAPLLLAVWRRRTGKRRWSTEPGGLATAAPEADLRVIHPLLSRLPAQADAGRGGSRMLLHGLVIACLLVGLSEPVLVGQRLPDPPQERDIVFIVDTSISMSLRDYLLDGQRVDRMTLLKGLLGRVIERLAGERMGLIVFGERAYTLVPLSRDPQLLHQMLARLETTVAGRFNAVGEAIALAVSQASRQMPGPAPGEKGRRRVLVLLTSASTPTGSIDPFAAATLASEANLPLYTIAIGAGSAEAEEQRRGGLIYRPADLATLRTLAAQTGALSFQAGDSNTLTQAIEDIKQRETNPREMPPRYLQQPLYLWPLLLGLALLCLGQLSRLRQSLSQNLSHNKSRGRTP